MCDVYSELQVLEYCRGEMPEPAAGRLAAHLMSCPHCRAVALTVRSLQELADEPPQMPSRAADRRVLAAITAAAARGRPTRRRFVRRAALAASVALVVGVVGAWWLASGRPEPVTLAEVHGEVVVRRGEQEWRAAAGTVLRPHDTVTVSAGGSAVVSLPDAGRAGLGSRTTVEVASSNRDALFLKEGFMDMDVSASRGDRVLRVRTPGAEAEVHGTRCTLAAGGGDTSLRVEEGRVQLTRTTDGAAVMVPAGYRAAVGGGDNPDPMTPVPTRTGEVLMIVSLERPKASWDRFNQLVQDRLVGERLQRMAYRVVVKNHTDVTPADVVGRPLVIVSLADYNVGLEGSLVRIGLEAADVPVLCMEPVAYPALGMTGTVEGRDFGFGAQPAMTVRQPDHPLVGGARTRDGLLKVGKAKIGWGVPSAEAAVVLTVGGEPDHAVMFGYEAGAQMVGRRAGARRVGLFLEPADAGRPTAPGWDLFDSAVEWCADRPEGGK